MKNLQIKNSLKCFKRVAIVLLLLFFVTTINAQRGAGRTATFTPEGTALSEKAFSFPEIQNYKGTYQFLLKERKNISIHSNLLEYIEASRKEDEDVIISIAPYCDVLILSKRKIQAADFSPFESSYKIQ